MLSEDGNKLIRRFKDPVDLIKVSDNKIMYIDRSGNIWRIEIATNKTKLLFKTGWLVNDDVYGKFLTSDDDSILYYIENSNPSSLKNSENSFVFKSISSKGNIQKLVSGVGKAFVIGYLSDSIIRILTSNYVYDINIKNNNYKKIKSNGDNSSTVYISQNYRINQKFEDIYSLEVISNKTNDVVFKYKLEKSFGIVANFNEIAKKILLIEITNEKEPNRLISLSIDNDDGNVIYENDLIGSAFFCR